jgi:hypothetical protein
MFYMMSNLCMEMKFVGFQWLFSEGGHGKGAPDGVGSAVKREADQFVANGGNIRNSADLLAILHETKISVVSEVRKRNADCQVL